MDDKNVQGSFYDVNSAPPIADEGIEGVVADPLALDIEDDELVKILDKSIEDSRDWFKNEKSLYARREKNELFYFGRQILEKEKSHLLKKYSSRFLDNVLYEIEATIKPLAMSRLPDLIVTPGQNSEESRLMSEEISKAVDTDIKSRQMRQVLGLAFKHLPVYFTGVIKTRWDPEIDDYVFECIHPDMIDVDHTSPTNNADDMRWISQILPLTVEEVALRFPNKKEDFYTELKKDGIQVDGTPSWKQLATTIKIREVWFTWYKKKSETEVEKVEGVLWKYKECILKKMRNPNFDYEGEQRYFTYQDNNKKDVSQEALQFAMITGQMPPEVQSEQVYHNYFDVPKKPFFFLGYDQWGAMPYDETSRIEQNIPNQEAVDKRGQQIEETLDNRGHHVWSKESGLTPADVANMDSNNPDQDYLVEGAVAQVHEYIPPARPDAAEYADKEKIEDRMRAVSGMNAVRGELQPGAPATSEQIAREANFTRADDLVEDTINAAAEWIASYALQFIKLRYTEDHFKKILGEAGSVVFLKLNQNMIDEGMTVMIKASGTDKMKAQNNALELAKLGISDPVNFFRDMNYPDYEERAQMAIEFKMNPQTYALKYIKDIKTSQDMAQALQGINQMQNQMMPPPPNSMMSPTVPQAPQGQPMPQGQPQMPTPQNTAQVPVAPPIQGAPPESPRIL